MRLIVHGIFFLLLFLSIAPVSATAESGSLPEVKMEDLMEDQPLQRRPKSQKQAPRAGIEGVGEDMKEFGETVANRVDRIIRKKSFDMWGNPWTFQGIPLIFPSHTGMNLGLKVLLADISRQDPHNLEIDSQLLVSDRGRYKHHFRLDLPHAFEDRFRLITRVAYDRDFTFNYYGIGNGTTVDFQKIRSEDPLYQTVRSSPSISINILRRVSRNVRLGPVFGFKWTSVTAAPQSLLKTENPVGVDGGNTHYLGFAVVRSTLDFEPYPSIGSDHELFTYLYHPLLGSTYTFGRITYTYRRYVPLSRKLIFAHRTLFESFIGDAPFYELGSVGGINPHLGFGGDRYLRGYPTNQFIDKIRMVLGFELRWDFLFFEFYKQSVSFGFVPFVDIGRVWSSLWPLDLSHWHPSAGFGARLAWNSRFILRADFSVTPINTHLHVDIGHVF